MIEASAGAMSRRSILTASLGVASALAIPGATRGLFEARAETRFAKMAARPAMMPAAPASTLGVRTDLLLRAKAALEIHGARLANRDRIAIADFSESSALPRFHLVNLERGETRTLLVAHGSGSDPAHTGFVQRFSNQEGSNASCEGAFVTADYYVGKHGRSQRLRGLDPTNSNALERAIVIHGAWYADPSMLQTHGKLGRSQGCFAVGDGDLSTVFARLGEGRLLYASKV